MADRGTRLHHVLAVGFAERVAKTGYSAGVPVPNGWSQSQREMLDELQQADGAARNQLDAYRAQVTQLQQRITKLASAGIRRQSRLTSAKDQLADAKEGIDTLQNMLAIARAAQRNAEERVGEQEDKLEQAEADLSQLQTQAQQADANWDELFRAVNQLFAELADEASTNEEFIGKIRELYDRAEKSYIPFGSDSDSS